MGPGDRLSVTLTMSLIPEREGTTQEGTEEGARLGVGAGRSTPSPYSLAFFHLLFSLNHPNIYSLIPHLVTTRTGVTLDKSINLFVHQFSNL